MLNLEIIERYKSIIMLNSQEFIDTVTFVKPTFGEEQSDKHLLWMLSELECNQEQSITKKHRWLGYIQGVLICKGYTTVAEEREETRELFNGD